MQRLSARIGTVTGKHIAQICYTEYRFVWRLLIWLMSEMAIIITDVQGVIATTTAIYLLSKGKIPLWGGVLFSVAEVLIFLFFDKYGLRVLESFMSSLMIIMAITFGIEFSLSAPNLQDMKKSIFSPWVNSYSGEDILEVGNTLALLFISPHAIYLHSGLVKTRNIDRCSSKKVREANYYFLIEMSVAFSITCFINLMVLSISATLLYNKTNTEMHEICENKTFLDQVFPNDNKPVSLSLESGGVVLGCKFGDLAYYIWAIGVLASGQSGAMNDSYAGQFIIEGFLNIKWVRWKRVVFTRTATLLPTLYLANYTNISAMNHLNYLIGVLMCVQLPFAALPTIAFSSNKSIMGEFANGLYSKVLTVLVFLVIISFKGVIMLRYLLDNLPTWPTWTQAVCILYATVYSIVFMFLILHTTAALFPSTSILNTSKFMKEYILGQSAREVGSPVKENTHVCHTMSTNRIQPSMISHVFHQTEKTYL